MCLTNEQFVQKEYLIEMCEPQGSYNRRHDERNAKKFTVLLATLFQTGA